VIELTLPQSFGIGSIGFTKDMKTGVALPDRAVGDAGITAIYPSAIAAGRGTDAPGGALNPVNIPGGLWIYGFLSIIEDVPAASDIDPKGLASDANMEDGPHYILEFDGIDLRWFELRSKDFDDFYPTNPSDHVDEQDGTSFFYLYARTTAEAKERRGYDFHTGFHITHADQNRRHKDAIKQLHSDHDRFFYLSVRAEPGEIVEDGLAECGWYLLNISLTVDGIGLPALNITSDGTTERNWVVQFLFPTDPVTQKRLHRVISADFVPDTNFNDGGDGRGYVLVPPPTIFDEGLNPMPEDILGKRENPFEIPSFSVVGVTFTEKKPPSWTYDPTKRPPEYDVYAQDETSALKRRVATKRELGAAYSSKTPPDDAELYFSDEDERSAEQAAYEDGAMLSIPEDWDGSTDSETDEVSSTDTETDEDSPPRKKPKREENPEDETD